MSMTKEKRAELPILVRLNPGTRESKIGIRLKASGDYYLVRTGEKPSGSDAPLNSMEQAVNVLADTLDAAEAEAGRLRKVVKRYKKAAEKVMPELSAMYNQLTGERLMRADPQHAVLIAYKMLEAARAAQGTSDAGKGETK